MRRWTLAHHGHKRRFPCFARLRWGGWHAPAPYRAANQLLLGVDERVWKRLGLGGIHGWPRSSWRGLKNRFRVTKMTKDVKFLIQWPWSNSLSHIPTGMTLPMSKDLSHPFILSGGKDMGWSPVTSLLNSVDGTLRGLLPVLHYPSDFVLTSDTSKLHPSNPIPKKLYSEANGFRKS